jgi:Zn-dependent M16 (insulinase) family peptidase
MTESTHGFEFIREETIPELNTRARLWRHAKTGAQLLSLENDDENKVFGINFRTPPTDSTGLPHILEHVVLAGSQKYPLKDPFFELVKGSLASFVNAMTYPDKTVYPAASTNLQDFYNLLDVYADAVFHPLLSPEKLAQEGWHYELETADAPLAYKGVVFNEMKGAYSSPDNLLGRYSQQATFPDITYGVDSGGDPAVIPDLTYEQFKRFHETYYHPSNALIFFYGDDDPAERLRRMDGYLSEFEPIAVESAIALQRPFDAPRVMRFPYGATADNESGDLSAEEDAASDDSQKSFIEVNWMLPEYEDTALVMALEILSYALVDTPASPLRKALIDSALGEDVIGGLSNYTRQMTFSAGLKGVAPDDAEKVEPLILDTLAELARDGFDPDMIAASVNTIEFALRENNTGRFPRGLALFVRALGTWLHDRDPLAPLAFEAPLAAVKSRLAAEPDYLQALIRHHLLDNPHRVTVILEPDPELNRRLEMEERARLDQARAAMNDDDVQGVIETTRALKEAQNMPDPPEVLAMLPSLTREDLDKQHKAIPIELRGAEGQQERTSESASHLDRKPKIIYHDLFTNGIVYLDLGLDLRALPAELLPYTSLFGQALLEMGTAQEDFVKLSQRIGRSTGGIYPTTLIAPVVGGTDDERRVTRDERSQPGTRHSELVAYLMLRGKSTPERAPEMLDILRDVLLTARLDNRERFRQIVLEAKAGAESVLAPAGHQVTNTRLRGHFHPAYRMEELIDGVENLLFLRRLAERVESDWAGVLADLEAIRARLVNRAGLIANVTLDEARYGAFAPRLAGFIGDLPATSQAHDPAASATGLPGLPRHEGLSFPAQVNFVGKGANLYNLGYELDGSIAVINNLLRTGYLLQKIRIQGGAYGAFCTFSPTSGVYTFLSYRDPNLANTLEVYDATADFLRGLELSDDELTRSIIGAIGAIDAYQLPDAKGYTSLTRHLTGETDERLQKFRDEVLSTTTADFRRLGDTLAAVKEAGDVVVLGSREALETANSQKELGLEITKVM